MKAIVISRPGPPEVLQLEETQGPEPAQGEVLVQVHAAGINRADLLQRQGLYPPPVGVRDDIPGLEFSGQVVRHGPDAEGFEAGDRVMGLVSGAAYAEYVTCPLPLLMPVPSGMTPVGAAAIPEVFITAYDALFHRLRLRRGQSLLIHAAASGVGTAAIQLAHQGGVRVLGTSSTGAKLEALAEMGLEVPINYREQSFQEAVLKATGGQGVDAILDLVGGDRLADNLGCLKQLGRMVVVGLVAGTQAKIDLSVLLRKRLTLVGTVLRSRSLQEKTQLVADFKAHSMALLESGSLRPVVDRVFPLSEAARAHAYMESNQNVGKIVLEVSRVRAKKGGGFPR